MDCLDPALSSTAQDILSLESMHDNNFTPDPSLLTGFVPPNTQDHSLMPPASGSAGAPQPKQQQQQRDDAAHVEQLRTPAPHTKQTSAKHKKTRRSGRSVPISGARNGTSWTEQEVRIVQTIIDHNLDIATAFSQIGRTTDAVKRKWRKMLVAQDKKGAVIKPAVSSTQAWQQPKSSTSSKLGETSASDLSDSSLSELSDDDEEPMKRQRDQSPNTSDDEDYTSRETRRRKRDADRCGAACDTCRLAHKRCDHQTSKYSGADNRDGSSTSNPSTSKSTKSYLNTLQQSLLTSAAQQQVTKRRGPGRPRKTDSGYSANQSASQKIAPIHIPTSENYIPRKRRAVEDYEFSEAFVEKKLLDADQLLETPKKWSARRSTKPSTSSMERTPHKYSEDESESAMRSTLPGVSSDASQTCDGGPLQPRSPGNMPSGRRCQPLKKRLTKAQLTTPTRRVRPQTSTPQHQQQFLESPDHLLKQPFVHGDRYLPIRPVRPNSSYGPARSRDCGLKGYILLSQLLNPTKLHTLRARKIAERDIGTVLDDSDPFASTGITFSNSAVREDTF